MDLAMDSGGGRLPAALPPSRWAWLGPTSPHRSQTPLPGPPSQFKPPPRSQVPPHQISTAPGRPRLLHPGAPDAAARPPSERKPRAAARTHQPGPRHAAALVQPPPARRRPGGAHAARAVLYHAVPWPAANLMPVQQRRRRHPRLPPTCLPRLGLRLQQGIFPRQRHAAPRRQQGRAVSAAPCPPLPPAATAGSAVPRRQLGRAVCAGVHPPAATAGSGRLLRPAARRRRAAAPPSATLPGTAQHSSRTARQRNTARHDIEATAPVA